MFPTARGVGTIKPAGRLARYASNVAWTVVVSLVLLHGWMLYRYTVDFPFQDDFTQLLAVPSYFDWHPDNLGKLGYIFSFSTEHRIATLRLLALTQAKLFGSLQFQWLLVYCVVVAATAAWLVAREAESWQRPWMAVLIALLLSSPALFENSYWASAALPHYGMIFYAFVSLYCAMRLRPAWTIWGILLAVAAACTAVHGLLVFIVACLVLALIREFRRAALWLIAGVTTFALYFLGFELTPGKASPIALLQDPIRFVLGWAASLGSIAGSRAPAIALGLVLVATTISVATMVYRGRCEPVLLAWLLFLVMSSATIAAGRLAWGDDAVLSSRYRIYSGMAVLTAAIALTRSMRTRNAAIATALLVVSACGWAVQNWKSDALTVADLHARQRLSLDRFVATGHGIYTNFPPQEFGDYLLTRARHRGDFKGGPASGPIVPIAAPPRLRTRHSKGFTRRLPSPSSVRLPFGGAPRNGPEPSSSG